MNARSTPPAVLDRDDAPILTEEIADRAQIAIGDKVLREATPPLRKRGRPAGSNKEPVTIRLDKDIVAKFKATGPGWQSRVNEVLKKAKVR